MTLRITKEKAPDGITTLYMSGLGTSDDIPTLKEEIEHLLSHREKRIIVDTKNLRLGGLTIVNELLSSAKAFRDMGGELVIAHPPASLQQAFLVAVTHAGVWWFPCVADARDHLLNGPRWN